MRVKRIVGISFVVLYMLLVAGCATKQVTVEGQPVTNETLKNAAQVVATADAVASGAVHFLMNAYTAGTIKKEVLVEYAQNIGPSVQVALDEAKDMLITLAKTPNATTHDRVEQVLNRLTSVVQQAVAFAQRHGMEK